jgi:hypothetical protein
MVVFDKKIKALITIYFYFLFKLKNILIQVLYFKISLGAYLVGCCIDLRIKLECLILSKTFHQVSYFRLRLGSYA